MLVAIASSSPDHFFLTRWQQIVGATSTLITSSKQLEKVIQEYNKEHNWSFDLLHQLEQLEPEKMEAFFVRTLPGMVQLLHASPNILTSPLPLLQAGRTHSITLSQQQVLPDCWISFSR